MTKEVMFSLMNRATNGNELLAVIDALTAENAVNENQNSPTLDPIEF